MADTELKERVRDLRERGRTPKEIARSLGVPPSMVASLIRELGAAGGRAQQERLIGCWANPGWSSSVTVANHPEWQNPGRDAAESGSSGLVTVVVARERGSTVLACGYLVDTWCLGVKDAVGPKSMERRKLPEFLSTFFSGYEGRPVEVPLLLAQHIVFGAIKYARGLGFEPHPDFAKAAGHLGQWDGTCDVRFGRDGMPVYIDTAAVVRYRGTSSA